MSDDEFLKMLDEVRAMLMKHVHMSTDNLFEVDDLYLPSAGNENRAGRTNSTYWSRTIMQNTLLNDCRRGVSSQAIFIDADVHDAHTPPLAHHVHVAAKQALCAEEIVKAIEHLPGKYRIVFDMCMAGYSYAQIAQRQGITLDTVRSRIRTVRKILQKQLKDYSLS